MAGRAALLVQVVPSATSAGELGNARVGFAGPGGTGDLLGGIEPARRPPAVARGRLPGEPGPRARRPRARRAPARARRAAAAVRGERWRSQRMIMSAPHRRLEPRLSRAVAALLGDHRGEDRPQADGDDDRAAGDPHDRAGLCLVGERGDAERVRRRP